MNALSVTFVLQIFILSSLFFHPTAQAQNQSLQKTFRATNIQHTLMTRPDLTGGNMIYGIPDAPKQLLGNYYLDTKWNKSTLMLYKNEEILVDQWVRYNISSNQFEVLSTDSDRVRPYRASGFKIWCG